MTTDDSTSAASARGLFKATGHTPKPKTVRLLDGSYGKTDKIMRAGHDFTPTPPEPTQSLVFYERARLLDFDLIWEPACGDGRMVRDLKDLGLNVVFSDLIDRGCGALIQDFLKFPKPLSPAIITNPPYNLCNGRDGQCRWMWHALETLEVEYMALLLSWSWPGAAATADLWAKHEPSRAYLMRWKIDFTGEGQPPMLNGWFIWDRKAKNKTCEFLMMDRHHPHQNFLFAPGEA